MEEIDLNILILGDSCAGKTSFLLRYVDNYFHEEQISSVGIDVKEKKINMNGIDINLEIWDTAGQERFGSISRNFFRNSDGIIFLYNITNKESFVNIRNWIRNVEESKENIKKIIVGNNMDLENKREVSKERLKNFCDNNNIRGFEVSTKLGINISECFEFLVKLIIGNKSKDELLETYNKEFNNKNISLDIKKKNKSKFKKKCI